MRLRQLHELRGICRQLELMQAGSQQEVQDWCALKRRLFLLIAEVASACAAEIGVRSSPSSRSPCRDKAGESLVSFGDVLHVFLQCMLEGHTRSTASSGYMTDSQPPLAPLVSESFFSLHGQPQACTCKPNMSTKASIKSCAGSLICP